MIGCGVGVGVGVGEGVGVGLGPGMGEGEGVGVGEVGPVALLLAGVVGARFDEVVPVPPHPEIRKVNAQNDALSTTFANDQ